MLKHQKKKAPVQKQTQARRRLLEKLSCQRNSNGESCTQARAASSFFFFLSLAAMQKPLACAQENFTGIS